APIPFFVLDRERRIRRANAAALRTFAAFGPELGGRPFSSLLSGPSQARVDDAFRSASREPPISDSVTAESASAAGKGWPMELTIVRLPSRKEAEFGAVLRDLRVAPSPAGAEKGAYTLAELLMANRLRELV
ncbi:MAG: PAS domain-containing protein, partial [Thermoplasmata archaeon]|nr:PAS domain-containing protein [Thermoplasmata archaeon]